MLRDEPVVEELHVIASLKKDKNGHGHEQGER